MDLVFWKIAHFDFSPKTEIEKSWELGAHEFVPKFMENTEKNCRKSRFCCGGG